MSHQKQVKASHMPKTGYELYLENWKLYLSNSCWLKWWTLWACLFWLRTGFFLELFSYVCSEMKTILVQIICGMTWNTMRGLSSTKWDGFEPWPTLLRPIWCCFPKLVWNISFQQFLNLNPIKGIRAWATVSPLGKDDLASKIIHLKDSLGQKE